MNNNPHSRIAIVDDDPAMRQAVGRLCRAADLPCSCFTSAEDFLNSDRVGHFSLLILDVNLPGLSGFELHHQLALRGIKPQVVFITGQDQPLSRKSARHAGAAYLTKPFKGEALISIVRRHLHPAALEIA